MESNSSSAQAPTPEGHPQKWRSTLDFVHLNSATGGLDGWPIPNIQQIINRIGTLKPNVFGIIDFTAGYHQTPLHPDSQEYTSFITQYWNRVAMGLKGSGPFFQRSMANKVLAGYVTRICEIYIDMQSILSGQYVWLINNTNAYNIN